MAKTPSALRKPGGTTTQLTLPLVKKTTFTLPRDLYKRLKMESAAREVEMSAIVAEALRNFLVKGSHEL